ncbi:MAG: protein kinase [Deltaproteobacteria bacterium]|nr:protein kinase [Deltaproteobacteria bacterium]
MELTGRLTRLDVSDDGGDADAPGPEIPASIGRFEVRRKLGEGGMGVVFAAYDAELDREVAIKLLRARGADAAPARARLLREARAMAKLSHPNVITIYDVGTLDEHVFIAMELVQGLNLRRWLRHRPRTWRGVLERFADAGAGLAAAHAAGIIHRDFKPDNVLVGDDGRVRVLDFGLARRIDVDAELTPDSPQLASPDDIERLTLSGAVMGTPAYMAPEQWRGLAIDHRTDQFAFCVALWEALFGQRPFGGTGAAAIATRVMSGDLRRPPEDRQVPGWLVRVLKRGLSVLPEQRFASMGELLDVLSRLGRERAQLEISDPVGPTGPLFARRYELRDEPGRRGPSIARDRLTRRLVALHRFASDDHDDDQRERLRTLAGLRHPNLVQVLDHGREGDEGYLACEHADAAVDWPGAGTDRPHAIAVSMVAQLLRAVESLHRRDLVHGALSPTAVDVLDTQVKLRDLVPCLGGETPTRNAGYLAPEVLLGEQRTPQCDLYGVGMLALELFTGQRPHEADDPGSVVDETLAGRDLQLGALEPELATWLRRMLQPDPALRFGSAELALRALVQTTRGTLALETVETRESALQTVGFAGRDAEWTALVHALRRSCDGAGETWLVGGESGVGKSRLLDELRAEAIARGALVVRGQARADGGRPHEVWRELFRVLALCGADEVAASVLAPVVPDIDQLRGRTHKHAPELDAQSNQQRLLRAVVWSLRAMQTPLVVLLDDVQWAGSEAIDLLDHLTPQLASLPVLVIASYRNDEAESLPGQVAGAKVMSLQPLGAAAIEQLARSVTGGRRDELVRLLQRESEGNPLLAVEVVRFLAEEAGTLTAIADMPLPEVVDAGGVRRMMRRRIERVAPWARPLLELAAVAGRALDLGLLARLEPTADLDRFVAHVTAATVIDVGSEGPRFRHDKLREYVLSELSDERRRVLHRRVGEALRARHGDDPGHAPALAHHFREAGDLAAEAHFSGLAGELALDNGAHRDAARLLARALELHGHGSSDRLQLMRWHRMLGEAHYVLGDLSRAVAGLGAAVETYGRRVPSSRLGWSWLLLRLSLLQLLLLAWPGRLVARSPSRRAAMDEAARAAGRLANLSTYSGDVLRIFAWSLLAANLSERAGRPGAYALAVMGYSASYMGMPKLADRYFARASAAAVERDDAIALVEALQMECSYRLGGGDLGRCRALVEDGYAAAERAGYQLGLALAEGFHGQCEYYLGNFQTMLAHYCRASELLTLHSPEHEHSFACGQAHALAMMGRAPEASALLDTTAARSGAQYLLGEAFVLAARCFIATVAAEPAAALEAAVATRRYVQARRIAIPPPCGQVLVGPAEALVVAARGLGTPEVWSEARGHLAQMTAWARKHPVGEAPALLFGARLAAIEGDVTAATSGLEQALVAAKRHALRFCQAQAELELGLLRGPHSEAGRGHLERARELCDRCGASHHAALARARLDAAALDPPAELDPDHVTRG